MLQLCVNYCDWRWGAGQMIEARNKNKRREAVLYELLRPILENKDATDN